MLDKTRLPAAFHPYIPYAELWGVADDMERVALINRAPEEAKAELQRVVAEIDDQLDDWLAGPEAESSNPLKEYIAFSAMRMSVDTM